MRIEALDDDAFVIERIGRDNAAVAVINKCPRKRALSIDLFAMPSGLASIWYGSANACINDGKLEVVLDSDSSALIILSTKGEMQTIK